ncbi:MAG: DUF1559 domain-containing protein [Planctomycetaceae bacterium]|nr:DUF1559 domain-containing protein [Planctomycetaceae bacterium]
MRLTFSEQYLIIAVLALTTATLNNTAIAQKFSSYTPHASISVLSRYLEADTTFVGWLDVTQVDLQKLAEFTTKFGSPFADSPEAEAIQKSLVQLGVTRIYVVGNVVDLGQGPPAILVPVKQENATGVAAILKVLAEHDHVGTAVMVDGAVLVGSPEEIQRLQRLSGNADAELLKHIRSIQQPHAFLVRTPATLTAPLVSLLPEIFGADDPLTTQAARLLPAVKNLTLSGQLPPEKFRLEVATDSSEAATAIAALLNGWTDSQLKGQSGPLQTEADGTQVVLKSDSMDQTLAIADSINRLTMPARLRAQRMSTLNSLKQIALAMHNFHESYGHFPPQALVDKDGKRLLSWRVLILPYLDNGPLYQQFHLDEPWDSPHNIKLVSSMPFAYRGSQTDEDAIRAGKTRMTTPLTKDSVFGRPGSGMKIQSILDGTSNTLLVAEAAPDQTFIWTKPDDVVIPSENPLSVLLDAAAKGFHACLSDGSARLIPQSIDEATLRALLTVDGREVIDFGKL